MKCYLCSASGLWPTLGYKYETLKMFYIHNFSISKLECTPLPILFAMVPSDQSNSVPFHALFLIAWLPDGVSLMCCIVMMWRQISKMFSTFSLWGCLFLMFMSCCEGWKKRNIHTRYTRHTHEPRINSLSLLNYAVRNKLVVTGNTIEYHEY